MIDFLVYLSFVSGLIPALALLYMYGFRVDWNQSPTGRALFYILVVTVLSLTLSVVVLTWPIFFASNAGEWIRIVVRFMIAGVLWNFLRIFLLAQRKPSPTQRTHHE